MLLGVLLLTLVIGGVSLVQPAAGARQNAGAAGGAGGTPTAALPDQSVPDITVPTPNPLPVFGEPRVEPPADVLARVAGCSVVSISAHDVAAAGCPGGGNVNFRTPADAPPMNDTVLFSPGVAPPTARQSAGANNSTTSNQPASTSGSGNNSGSRSSTNAQRVDSSANADSSTNPSAKGSRTGADNANQSGKQGKKHHKQGKHGKKHKNGNNKQS